MTTQQRMRARMKGIVYTYQTLRVSLILVIFYVLISALEFNQYIGYPNLGFGCLSSYSAENDCLHSLSSKSDHKPTFEVFLTIHQANMAGAACDYQASYADEKTVHTPILDLVLMRTGDVLEVNGVNLRKGDTFEASDYRESNPWIISHTQIKNLGVISICEGNPTRKSMEIVGSYGTYFSFIKGIGILLLLGAIWNAINYRLKVLKKE